MNTVTIGLEEYLQLRKLRDEVFEKTYYVHYWNHNEIFYYEISTNDKELERLIQSNKELADAIVAQSKLIQPKKKWWKL